jgi:hypothetical protein
MKALEKAIDKMNNKVVLYTNDFDPQNKISSIRFKNFYGRIKNDNFIISGNVHGRSVTLPVEYIKKIKNNKDKFILNVDFGNGKNNVIRLDMSNQDGIISRKRY